MVDCLEIILAVGLSGLLHDLVEVELRGLLMQGEVKLPYQQLLRLCPHSIEGIGLVMEDAFFDVFSDLGHWVPVDQVQLVLQLPVFSALLLRRLGQILSVEVLLVLSEAPQQLLPLMPL